MCTVTTNFTVRYTGISGVRVGKCEYSVTLLKFKLIGNERKLEYFSFYLFVFIEIKMLEYSHTNIYFLVSMDLQKNMFIAF